MAIQTEPATSAIFRAFRSVDVDPDLAYETAAKPGRTSSPPLESRLTPKAPGSMLNFLRLSPRSPRSGPKLKPRIPGLTFFSG